MEEEHHAMEAHRGRRHRVEEAQGGGGTTQRSHVVEKVHHAMEVTGEGGMA